MNTSSCSKLPSVTCCHLHGHTTCIGVYRIFIQVVIQSITIIVVSVFWCREETNSGVRQKSMQTYNYTIHRNLETIDVNRR